jgi:ribosomal protein L11 methylase PrmA
MQRALDDFEFVRSSGFLTSQIALGRVIQETPVDGGILGARAEGAQRVVEHPRLPFISYPYEWPFSALKAAALLQLDLSLDALKAGIMLSDASAYNIQFRGAQPVFIDTLSFRRYREGEYWTAHRQFCEQFLNPLLLRALCGVSHNSWYRGSLEGISTQDLTKLVPLRRKLSWNVFAHVVLQARLQATRNAAADASRYVRERKLPRSALSYLLQGLRNWVAKLRPANAGKTEWSTYASVNSYSAVETDAKAGFIAEFVRAVRPNILWDIGCNTGAYSEVALLNGATSVTGFDFDQDALDQAFARASAKKLNFTSLFLDAANPTPSQGWMQTERPGMSQRANGDAVIALAVVHHLAIARNIPLERVVDWLVAMAPHGVIEFVPMDDPMVRRLLSLRENIFVDYNEDNFIRALEQRAHVVNAKTVSVTGRCLYRYERHQPQ